MYFTDHMASSNLDCCRWLARLRDRPIRAVLTGPGDCRAALRPSLRGLKAYRHEDGTIWTFQDDRNAERLIRSARRLALPTLPADDFLCSIEELVAADVAWVPTAPERSLYLRPFMFATEAFLGVRPAKRVTYCCIASQLVPTSPPG